MEDNTNYAVGRTLRWGFDSFLVSLAAAIGVAFAIEPLQSSMSFLLLVPAALSVVSMLAYYNENSGKIDL